MTNRCRGLVGWLFGHKFDVRRGTNVVYGPPVEFTREGESPYVHDPMKTSEDVFVAICTRCGIVVEPQEVGTDD